MRKKVYLVKNGMCNGKQEWIQMEGEQFYGFLHSEAGQGRFFIRLVDDISFEADDIIIETTKDEYEAWRKEYRHHKYLMEMQCETKLCSLDAGNQSLLEKEILDCEPSMEDSLIEKDEIVRLREVVAQFDSREKWLLQRLFAEEYHMTQRELAEQCGVSVGVINKWKRKLLDKIKRKYNHG